MRPIDEADFADWRARVLTWGDEIGFAGYLLGLTSLVVIPGITCWFMTFLVPGTYLTISILAPGLIAAMVWFLLTARLFYRLHLRIRRTTPRARRVVEPPPAFTGPARPLHCRHCGRFAAARWQTCLFCKRNTGTLRGPRYFAADERLSSFRGFGVGVSLALATACAFLLEAMPVRGVIAIIFTSLFFLSHLFAAWHFKGWVAACAGWLLLAAGSLFLLIPAGWPALWAIPAAITLVWMGSHWKTTRARLIGEDHPAFKPISDVPVWSPCVDCGSRDSTLRAPLICVSLGMTVRWALPMRSVCDAHAKRRAFTPSLITFLFGWWGIPWGLIWTVEVLQLNSGGGATLEDRCLRDLRREEEERGETLSSSSLFEFVVGLIVGAALAFSTYGHLAQV